MDLVCLGTIALDSVETPFGKKDGILGGSATYFGLAAGFFSKCGIIGVVGKDFPDEHLLYLNRHQVDTSGVEKTGGETFRWSGFYEFDMNTAHTKETQLNVLADFKPKIPDEYENCEFLFLANIDPVIQLKVLDEIQPKHAACDTMNYWIESKKEKVSEIFEACDMIVINEGEARQYCGIPNLIKAGNELLKTHTDRVIIKKGEHGAIYFSRNGFFSAPAYPIEEVIDPTGAGDSFAGGTIGHLAKHKSFNDEAIKKSLVIGSIIASYVCEDFSIERTKTVTQSDIEQRYDHFKRMVAFDHRI